MTVGLDPEDKKGERIRNVIVVSKGVGRPAESFLQETNEDIAIGVRNRTGRETASPIKNPSSHSRVMPMTAPITEKSKRIAPPGSIAITSTPIKRLKSRTRSSRRMRIELTISPTTPGQTKTAPAKTDV